MATISNLKVGQFDPASTGMASASQPGILSTGAQTIAGAKSMVLSDLNGGQLAGFRNRIINGDMRCDSRVITNVFTLSANVQYTVDRWNHTYASVTGGRTITVQRLLATPPAGFTSYIRTTQTSAGAAPGASEVVTTQQIIEGYMVDDLDWGKTTAKTMTLSFWFRASNTGVYGGAIGNGTGVGRACPFQFTVSAANTWEYKTIVITPDMSNVANTWVTDNRPGLSIRWGVAVDAATYGRLPGQWTSTDLYTSSSVTTQIGTIGSGAFFDLTGVQFEIGSQATPFERRSFQTELQLCRRYYHRPEFANNSAAFAPFGVGYCAGGTGGTVHIQFPGQMRTIPALITSTASTLGVTNSAGSTLALTSISINANAPGVDASAVNVTVASGLVAGNVTQLVRNNNISPTNSFIAFDAEM